MSTLQSSPSRAGAVRFIRPDRFFPTPLGNWGGGEVGNTLAGIRAPRAVPRSQSAAHRGRAAVLPVENRNPAFPATSPRGGETVFAQLRLLEQTSEPTAPVPLMFDFDKDPEPPDYVVGRLFERQTVNVLSGDTGAGKSLVMASLLVAICSGASHWLCRDLDARRVLVVDEENPARIVHDRLQALGLANEHLDALRYFNRQGFSIGDQAWNERLREAALDHQADLIVIDTAAAATTADVNDNDAVARLYSKVLRPIATDLNAAVVILHHERKLQPGQTRDAGQAMMGARQWAGQADTHVALRVSEPLSEEPGRDGLREMRTVFQMRTPKVRSGWPDIPRVIIATSERDDADRLLSMKVVDGGIYERAPSKQDLLHEQIVQLLHEKGQLTRGAIAEHLEDSTSLDRALSQAHRSGAIAKPKRGVYAPVDQPAL